MIARKYISKVTFELSATSGELTTKKLSSAVLTIVTSNALDANPIHGRHARWATRRQISTEISAATTVTANPEMNIGTSGWCTRFHVGAMSRRPMATMRTRATTLSPSMPASTSASSGRDHSGGAATPAV